ncbi:MAG: hypothetical protein V1789_01070 [PVC group bacterium]
MVKSFFTPVSLLLIFLFVSSILCAETAELADRQGLESVWKRSGRTTGVIDYPYSPQPGIYGGKDVRQLENRGYIFINPRTEEFAARRPGRRAEEAPAAPVEADCAEIRKALEDEVVRSTRLLEEQQTSAEDLRQLSQKADDQALKIEALEFEITQFEEQAAASAGVAGVEGVVGGGIAGGGPEVEETGTYLVEKDDNLWTIAGKPGIYNDPYRWLLLYHANRDQIFEPDLIYPGMVLLVPRYRGMERPPSAPAAEEPPAAEESPVAEKPPAGAEDAENEQGD